MQKPTANRLVRWWEVFSEYNVQFEHVEGQKNIVANALSRSWNKPKEPTVLTALKYKQNNPGATLTYTGDEEFEELWKEAKQKGFLLGENVTVKGRVCVPKVDRKMILWYVMMRKGILV
jgi:hypothetical protein